MNILERGTDRKQSDLAARLPDRRLVAARPVPITVGSGTKVRPHRRGAAGEVALHSLLLGVAQEIAEELAVGHARQGDEEGVVELEFGWALLPDVMDNLEELQQHGRALVRVGHRAEPLAAHVTKCHEVLLHQDAEAGDGSEERVDEKLREGADLARAVPAVAAVNKRMRPVAQHQGNLQRRAQQQTDVPEPAAGVQLKARTFQRVGGGGRVRAAIEDDELSVPAHLAQLPHQRLVRLRVRAERARHWLGAAVDAAAAAEPRQAREPMLGPERGALRGHIRRD